MSKPNPVVHFEMPCQDRKRVADFYTQAFGWQMNQLGEEMGNYLIAQTTETDEGNMVKTPGTINGGFWETQEKSYPHVVISVDDLDKSIKAVEEAGGKIVGEKMDIPGVGMYVSFEDTEGNNVGILQPSNSR